MRWMWAKKGLVGRVDELEQLAQPPFVAVGGDLVVVDHAEGILLRRGGAEEERQQPFLQASWHQGQEVRAHLPQTVEPMYPISPGIPFIEDVEREFAQSKAPWRFKSEASAYQRRLNWPAR